MKYTIEQIKNFTDAEFQEFRKEHWLEQKAIYDINIEVPDWFWRSEKAKDNERRKKAWIAKCKKFASSEQAPNWYIPNKAEYVLFLEKKEIKKIKISEQQQIKKNKEAK